MSASVLLVAGDHAKNDMAGEKEVLEELFLKKDMKWKQKIRGLGECEGIRRMFYQHLKEATELRVKPES